METVKDFIFLGSKITADGDWSHEIKRRLLLGRKAMTSLGSILKSRDVTLPTKIRIVKAMIFPIVMYGCESWTIKKAEHRRIDAYVLWCWRRLLRVPSTAKRSNWSILKEINPEYSLEGLTLKLQYFGHLMERANSLEETPMWKDRRQEEKGTTEDEMVGWHHWLDGHEFEQAPGDRGRTENPSVLPPMGFQRARHDWVTKQQQQSSPQVHGTLQRIQGRICLGAKFSLGMNSSSVFPGCVILGKLLNFTKPWFLNL